MLRTENRGERRQLDFADAREVVKDLLLFVAQLCLVGQDLPLAAATFAVMRAVGFAAFGGRLNQTLHTRFYERVFAFRDLQIDHIARHAIRHEANDVACSAFRIGHRDAGNSFAFRTDAGDGDGLYER